MGFNRIKTLTFPDLTLGHWYTFKLTDDLYKELDKIVPDRNYDPTLTGAGLIKLQYIGILSATKKKTGTFVWKLRSKIKPFAVELEKGLVLNSLISPVEEPSYLN